MMDSRLTPMRNDLVAHALHREHPALRPVHPQACRVVVPSLPLRRVPDGAAAYETELLYGEAFDVYALEGGFAWGQARRDSYVGYLPASGLAATMGDAPTHRISALRSFVYPAPSIKATPLMALPYNALVRLLPDDEGGATHGFTRIDAGFVYTAHLTSLSQPAPGAVAEAERFIGIPYLWGGKSSFGLDCSGLVENVCFACAIPALRDSDMQEKSLGLEKPMPAKGAAYARGDLLFWPGHVAIAQGNGRMIHANAHHMMVASEPIDEAMARIAAKGTQLRTVRSLPAP